MTTYAFLLDLGRCIGCQGCVAACKTGNELSPGTQYITISEQTRGTFPNVQSVIKNHRCFHCADAACVAVCPTGALFKEDGLTRLNAAQCSGCAYCVDACPFDVPRVVEGRSTKCDGCAEVVKAGGEPWCVKTCPSNALMYGERETILAEAHRRAEMLQTRYPNAQVYGETQLGGLGLVMVLPDQPEQLDLPANPQTPAVLNTWQNVVQPASVGFIGFSLAFTGLASIIARRNHKKEVAQLHAHQDKEDQP